MEIKNKLKMTFAALALGGGGYLAGVTVTDDASETTEIAVSYEDIHRLGRDHAEAQRKAAQEAGDDWLRQSWLVERRLFEAIISLRELRKRTDTAVPPDPPPDPDPVDPDPIPAEDHIDVPADAPVGYVSNIAAKQVGDRHVINAAVVLEDGWYGVLHIQDTETWEVVAGDSVAFNGDEQGVYHLTLIADLQPGRYQAQAWAVQVVGGEKQRGQKIERAIDVP